MKTQIQARTVKQENGRIIALGGLAVVCMVLCHHLMSWSPMMKGLFGN